MLEGEGRTCSDIEPVESAMRAYTSTILDNVEDPGASSGGFQNRGGIDPSLN
jgi:hypothetical protein